LSAVINGQAVTTLFDGPNTSTMSLCATTDTDLSTTGYTYCVTATPLASTIYVSALSGNDTNSGTQASPVQTIARALQLLSCTTTGSTYIYLEAGNTFTGTSNTNLTISLNNLAITNYVGTHGTAYPVITMQNSGRFATISAGCTATISNLVLENGYMAGHGGAIDNFGTLYAFNCILSNNSATYGGALANETTGTTTITCSRFVGNSATYGSTIYNFGGRVTATNNWWETNYPNPSILFANSPVTYTPYIMFNLLPEPLWPHVGCASLITADFTENSSGQANTCTIMNGMPVIFSASVSDVTISPTLSYVVNGQAITTLYDNVDTNTFLFCVHTDSDISITGYTYCVTATPFASAAIYVSVIDGNDDYPGTQTYPVKTIAQGLALAQCAITPTVYLQMSNTFTGIGNNDLTITLTNLVISTYQGTHGSANPIIDMSGMPTPVRFCTINANSNVVMNNIVVQHGNVATGNGGAICVYGTLNATDCMFDNNIAGTGGAIYNNGDLYLTSCIFNSNSAAGNGGAIENNGGLLQARGCILSNNNATRNGGAVENDAGSLFIGCNRFVGNTAAGSGNAIYNNGGTELALAYNWWGTNAPDGSYLFANTIGSYAYTPWIVLNLLPTPLWPRIGCPSAVVADFTKNSDGSPNNCTIMNGMPVGFSTTGVDVIVSPTLSSVVANQAGTTLYDIPNTNTFYVCAKTDIDLTYSGYTYCTTATPIYSTGIYVSASHGNDTNPGTITLPVQTIAQGIILATCPTATVYLEAGDTFTGSLNNNLTIRANNITIDRYGVGANPIIDMAGTATLVRFATINSGATVTMNNLVIQHGNGQVHGGVIHNYGTLYGTGCIFDSNSALYGGVIANEALAVATISCSRFIDNRATYASAIYNSGGTVTATNNWWETDYPDASALFYNTAVNYNPWIVINLSPNPLWPRLLCASPVLADFTKNSAGSTNSCTIMNGMPVIFSTNGYDVTISPTLSYIVNGQAGTTLYDIPNTSTFSFCVHTDSDLSLTGYTYCATATPTNLIVVYVSATNGNDANLGNSTSDPVQTIARALERVSCLSTSVNNIYLEAGNVYSGSGDTDLTITISSLTIGSYGTGANPIINMAGSGRFVTINPGIDLTLNNLLIENGSVPDNGGAILNNGTLNANGCTFMSNYAANHGGALASGTGSSSVCTNCIFSGNHTSASNSTGGALYNSGGTVILTGCLFNGNGSSASNMLGGAIYNDTLGVAGIKNLGHTLYVYNTVYNDNSAVYGGAIYNYDDTVYLVDCTFTQNSALYGGAFANVSATLQTTVSCQGCTFTENSATDDGGALYNVGTQADAIVHCSRFGGNLAPNGSAIYNDAASPTVEAQDNWWGSNANPSSQFSGSVDVDPWITVTIAATPLGHGNFSVVAAFSESCMPDGTPVLFSTTDGTITPSATVTNNGAATASISDLFATTATICMTVGPGAEAFQLCTVVQGFNREYMFQENSTIDICTEADVIYALDWYQGAAGSSQPPLLAAGGAINGTRSCEKSNIFVYTLDNICLENGQGPINPTVLMVTEGTFDSDIVNAVRWCQPTSCRAPLYPYLAVGGQTSGQAPMTNARVYYIDPASYTLNSLAYAPENSLSSINAVAWNPGCNCSTLAVGGCQDDDNIACNIIAYDHVKDQELNVVDQVLFDTSITSLDWCKTNTIPINLCAYLAVGATGTTPMAGGKDTSSQIMVYQATFCKNAHSNRPCNR
jgi:predicted outer membrane repeat protein